MSAAPSFSHRTPRKFAFSRCRVVYKVTHTKQNVLTFFILKTDLKPRGFPAKKNREKNVFFSVGNCFITVDVFFFWGGGVAPFPTPRFIFGQNSTFLCVSRRSSIGFCCKLDFLFSRFTGKKGNIRVTERHAEPLCLEARTFDHESNWP